MKLSWAVIRALFVFLVIGLTAGCSADSEAEAADDAAELRQITGSLLAQAVSRLERANTAAEANGSRLGDQLRQVGPALTGPQIAIYTRTFHNQTGVEEAEREVVAASLGLEQLYRKNAQRGTWPIDDAVLAGRMGTVSADAAVGGAALLAKSPHALTALHWSTHLLSLPKDSKVFRAYAGQVLPQRVWGPAFPRAYAQAYAEEGTHEGAFERISGMVEALTRVNPAESEVAIGLNMLNHTIKGRNLDSFHEGMKGLKAQPIFRGMSAAGLFVCGTSFVSDARSGDLWKMTVDAAGGAESASELLLTAAETVRDSSRYARYTTLRSFVTHAVPTLEGFAEHVAPVLGIIAYAANLGISAGELRAEGNVGTWAKAIGGAIMLAGSILEVTPLAPAGLIALGVGQVITLLGQYAAAVLARNAIASEIRTCLTAAKVDKALQEVLVSADAVAMRELNRGLGYGPAQVEWLVRTSPLVARSPGAYRTILNVDQAFGFTSKHGYLLLHGLLAGIAPGNQAVAIYRFMTKYQSFVTTGSPSPARAWMAMLQADAAAGDFVAGNARAFLQASLDSGDRD